MVLTHLVRRGGAPGAGQRGRRIGEAARRDGARLRAGPQHGSGAGRGGAGRGAPAGAERSGKARRGRRGGREGVPAARASIGHTARIRRPCRSCTSECATVGRRRHPADWPLAGARHGGQTDRRAVWLAGRGWSAGQQLVDRGPCVAGVPLYASVCAAVRTSHVNMRCPKRQARLVSERLIHKLDPSTCRIDCIETITALHHNPSK